MRPAHARGLHATLRTRLYTCPLPRASLPCRTTYAPALFRAFHPQLALRAFENDRTLDNAMTADEPNLTDRVAPENTEFSRRVLGQHEQDNPDDETSLDLAYAGMLEVEAQPESAELTEVGETTAVEPPVEFPYEFTFTIPPKSPPPELPSNVVRTTPLPPSYFSHTLFRGPDDQHVKVDYCCTLEESESVAKEFLSEKIVGFDMEWLTFGITLKEQISLIQVASADRIALFHVARHPGNTVPDLIAPSLRRLIESPDIIKTGVMVWRADGQRLKRFCGFNPQGFVEVSHIHNLVENKRLETTGAIRKGSVALESLVEMHLGWPLHKGEVRTSNWTRQLNQEQIDYAAADAYAGFQLYHVLNNKRIAMDPPAPHPPFAELNLPIRDSYLSSGKPKKAATKATKGKDSENTRKQRSKQTRKETVEATGSLSREDLILFEALRARRRTIFHQIGKPAWRIAADTTLRAIAKFRPKNFDELSKIWGMSDTLVGQYGQTWLEVIRTFDNTTLTPNNLPPGAEGALLGMKFVFTGILDTISRDEVEEIVQKCGGVVTKEPDETTTYVVTGQDVSQHKLDTISTYNLSVLDENGFCNLVREKAAERISIPNFEPGDRQGNGEAAPQSSDTPLPPLAELIGTATSGSLIRRNPFLNALHGLRTRISVLSKLAPNVIASDSTLLAISERMPRKRTEFQKIPGTTTLESVGQLCNIDVVEFVAKHAKPSERMSVSGGQKYRPINADAAINYRDIDDMDFVDSSSMPDFNLAPPPGAKEMVSRPFISPGLGQRIRSREYSSKEWVYGQFLPPPPPRRRKF